MAWLEDLIQKVFSPIFDGIAVAGKVILRPVVTFMGGLMSVMMLSFFDVFQIILLFVIDIFMMIVSSVMGGLGLDTFDATQLWTDFNNTPWGADIIYTLHDMGIVTGLGIILTAMIIKLILMMIPFFG